MYRPYRTQIHERGFTVDTLYNYWGVLICLPCVSEETIFVQFNSTQGGGWLKYLWLSPFEHVPLCTGLI